MKRHRVKEKVTKLMSLLLVTALFLTTQDFTVFADSISENAVIGGEVQEDGDNENEMEVLKEDGQPESFGDEEDFGVEDGSVSENAMRVGAGTPANPVHYCTQEDYTDWSYIYFGSYPQSEVTDSATIAAIDNEIDAAGMDDLFLFEREETYYPTRYVDVYVNETRYRRIIKVIDGTFGHYDAKYYFKWEPIKWKVLKNDGNTLFVVVDRAVDCRWGGVNEYLDNHTWENRYIRKWLNDEFYTTAFSSNEQSAIATQNVVNESHPENGTEGGNNTNDKVYLLSIGEVTNENYGFCSDYSINSMSRRMTSSDYADRIGAAKARYESDYNGNCWWWLRSPGYSRDNSDYGFAYVNVGGKIETIYHSASYVGICPALHINLSSDAWTIADENENNESDDNSNRVQMPKANVIGGSYSKLQKITLSTGTKGAKIYYTIDGTKPSKENGNLYKGEIAVANSLTLKAIAIKEGMEDSLIMSKSYKFAPQKNKTPIPAPTLGEKQKASVEDKDFLQFFPGNFELSDAVLPISLSKSTEADGSYSLKIAIGIECADVDKVWDMYKEAIDDMDEAKNKAVHMRRLMEQNGGKTVVCFKLPDLDKIKKPEISAIGYYELEIDKNGNIVKNSGRMQTGAEWKASVDWMFATPAGPVYLSLGGSGEITGELGASYYIENNDFLNGSWKIEGKVDLTPSIFLEGGYGVKNIATVGAQGTLGIPIQIVPASKGDIELTASVHVYVVFVTEETYDLAKYSRTLWDTTKDKAGARSGASNDIASNIEINSKDLKPVDRSYAEYTTSWQGDMTAENQNGKDLSARAGAGEENATGETGHVLQSGVMPNTLPMIKQIGNDTVMVFQANAAERNTLDSSVLMYSVCSNGTWSKPVPVWDNGTCDMYADMQLVGNNLYLVWQKENAKVTADGEDGQQALDEMAEKSEICFAKYDQTEKKFKDVTYITSDKKVDMTPKLAANGDKVTAAWITNSENSFLPNEGTYRIVYADLVNGSFTAEKVLYESESGIEEFVPYYEEGVLHAAYASNTSKENAANQIYLISAEGESRKVSEGSTGNANLQWQDGVLYYYEQGTMKTYNTATGALSTITAGDSPIGANGRIYANDGKTAVIWSALDQIAGTSNVYSSVKTAEGFSEPVALYTTTSSIKYLDGILNPDGSWQFIMNTADTSEQSIHSLVAVSKEEAPEVRVEDITVEDAAKENEATPISYMVTNTSEETITNLVLTITDGNTFNKQQNIPVSIAPGETFYDTVNVDLTEVKDTTKVKITINAQGQTDTGSNTVEEVIGQTDLSLEAIMTETEEDVCIVASVSNNSAIPANATLTLYGDVEQTNKLEEVSLGEVIEGKGGRHTFYLKKSSLVMNENGAAYMPLVVTSDKIDSNEYNNSVIKIAYATLDDPVKDDKPENDKKDDTTESKDKEEGDSSKEEGTSSKTEAVKVSKLAINAPSKKLAAGKKVKLTLEVTPENASNKAVTWKTSNKKYATVDKNGKLTLKKAGAGKNVTITAETKDGSGKKATIKIKVMKHAVKSIKLKAPAKTLKAGKSMSIKATVKTTGKSVNKTLKWQSSNTKYATVNKKGKVTAKKAGKGKTVTITAASTDGSNKKAKVKIKIK